MTHEERTKKLPPGSRWWWAERQGGEVVRLSLVEVMWHVSWASDVFVRSVRSGKRYGVGENDLLPLSAFADPSDTHGRPRGERDRARAANDPACRRVREALEAAGIDPERFVSEWCRAQAEYETEEAER